MVKRTIKKVKCKCGHWYLKHDVDITNVGECLARGCKCKKFSKTMFGA